MVEKSHFTHVLLAGAVAFVLLSMFSFFTPPSYSGAVTYTNLGSCQETPNDGNDPYVDAYAVARAIIWQAKFQAELTEQKTLAGLYLSTEAMLLVVIHHGEVIYMRESTWDGRSLLRHFQQQKTVETASLESLSQLETLKQFLQFYNPSDAEKIFRQLIIAGEQAITPHLLQWLEQKLGYSMLAANPFQHMQFASHIDSNELLTSASALVISCGLAMRSNEQ